MTNTLGNSTEEQELLRAAALWAADCAEESLSLFENRHPNNTRPRSAIDAGREFGRGKKRDRNLRALSLDTFKLIKDLDEPSKQAVRAASLAAAVAYTHTDLQAGLQGIRQAKHILGPAVHAAYALELVAGSDTSVGSNFILRAVDTAPNEVRRILKHMPAQPKEGNRLDMLFSELDTALRTGN